MISRKSIVILLFIPLISQSAFAQELVTSSEEALGWLRKITNAPRQHNYLGTFVYYADGHIETSRIVHMVDQDGEHERIEVLDGLPRIVFRNNDEMKCYLPEGKKIYTEKRWFRKFFPDLLPQLTNDIDKNYDIKLGKRERVTGYDCQVMTLIPRDNLRYTHKFWIHSDTGLLLKAAVITGDGIVEQFAFAHLEIDGDINSELLKPNQTVLTEEWQTTNLLTSMVNEGELAWQTSKLPTGFKKLVEMKRHLTEKQILVDHIAISDGLATVSIFIEPITEQSPPPVSGFFSSRGAINIYVRILDGNKITTVGEVPLETIKLIGDSVFKQEQLSITNVTKTPKH